MRHFVQEDLKEQPDNIVQRSELLRLKGQRHLASEFPEAGEIFIADDQARRFGFAGGVDGAMAALDL